MKCDLKKKKNMGDGIQDEGVDVMKTIMTGMEEMKMMTMMMMMMMTKMIVFFSSSQVRSPQSPQQVNPSAPSLGK